MYSNLNLKKRKIIFRYFGRCTGDNLYSFIIHNPSLKFIKGLVMIRNKQKIFNYKFILIDKLKYYIKGNIYKSLFSVKENDIY